MTPSDSQGELPARMLISDPRVLGAPVDECGEPLVDVRIVCPEISVYSGPLDRYQRPTESSFFVRAGLAERLSAAQAALPVGVTLELFEGWRSRTLQATIYNEYIARLSAEHSDWSIDTVHRVASEFVAPPTARPPHSTGGAVDITLLDRNGPLDFGCPINWSGPESRMDAQVDAVAHRTRSVLARACSSAGLINYPYEWWHWSYGDPYWAVVTDHDAAVYDAIDLSSAP